MGLIEEPGRVIIITNYVTGMNLFELVHSDKKVHYVCGHDHSALVLFIVQVELAFQEKVYIVEQIAQALVFMHQHEPPIVHLDIKPENILVRRVQPAMHLCTLF